MRAVPGKDAPAPTPPPTGKAATNPAPAGPSEESFKARIKALEEERDRLKNELGDVRDRFLRSRADYDNLVRRSSKEVADSIKAAKGSLLLKFVHLVETLERAIGEVDRTAPGHEKGLKMVLDEARRLLKDEGVKEIESMGQTFNHRFHQAVETLEREGTKPETIIEVVQRGYLIQGEVLRTALVKVAAAPKAPSPVKDAGAAKA